MSVGIIVGTAVLTSDLLEGRYELHMRAAEAEGLTQDTRVELQGLAIGRVTQVNPHLDTATNALSFIATLSIRERFPDGTRLRPGAFLQPGDTLESERRAGVMQSLSEIAAGMHEDALAMVTETRQLLTHTTRAVDQTNTLLASARPRVEDVLERLSGSLERTDRILAEVEPRVGPVTDSIMATLAHTHEVLAGLDSLASTAHDVATENREAVAEMVAKLSRSAEILEYFAEQISRRPLRMLWGVTPPPDTADEQQ